jgi:hypothetical protein
MQRARYDFLFLVLNGKSSSCLRFIFVNVVPVGVRNKYLSIGDAASPSTFTKGKRSVVGSYAFIFTVG